MILNARTQENRLPITVKYRKSLGEIIGVKVLNLDE